MTEARISIRLERGLAARAKAAYQVDNAFEGATRTFSEWCAQALEARVEQIEDRYNEGRQFPATPTTLPPGPKPAASSKEQQ